MLRSQSSGGSSVRHSRCAWVWTAGTAAFLQVVYLTTVLRGAAMPDGSGGIYGMDFRDTVWLPLRGLAGGVNPWHVAQWRSLHPYAQNFPLYTPDYWWLCAPLAILPFRVGLAMWTFFSVAFLALTVQWLADRLVPTLVCRWPWFPGVALLVVALGRPGRGGLTAANWATPCACAAAFLLVGVRRSGWESVLGALALVKPQVGIPLLVILLFLSRQRRAAVRIMLLGAALAGSAMILMVWRFGLGPVWRSLVYETLPVGDGVGAGPGTDTSTRVDAAGLVGHLVAHDVSGAAGVLLLLLPGILYAVGYLWARRLAVLPSVTLLLGGLLLCLVLPNQVYAVPVVVPAMIALAGDVVAKAPLWDMALMALMQCGVAFVMTGPIPRWCGLAPREAAYVAGVTLHLAALTGLIMLGLAAHWPTSTAAGRAPERRS